MSLLARSTLAIALLFLVSCEQERKPLVVWSNVPDTAFLLELYTRESDQPVHFRFFSNLTEALTQQRVEADLVIGRWVDNPPASAIIAADQDKAPWEPLAFNLGTIVFDSAHTRLTPDHAVTPEQIGENLVSRDGESPEPMRFVPSHSARFLYEMMRLDGVAPEPAPGGGPGWDPEDHDRAFSRIRSWQKQWNGSVTEERAYLERYLYEPWYRLLENRRVRAVYLPSQELFDWSFFGGTTLDFRWLGEDDGTIPVLEDVVYAGIPDASARKPAARRLLSWITTTDTQLRFVEYKFEQRIDTFGIFGGLSALPETNTKMAHRFYPELAGRIPDPGELAFPGPRARYWNEALAAVVRPYLLEAAKQASPESGESPAYDGEGLRRALLQWYNQRGD